MVNLLRQREVTPSQLIQHPLEKHNMHHPLLLADKFMDLLAEKQLMVTHKESVFLYELEIADYITRGFTSVHGLHVSLQEAYLRSEAMINDMAFIAEMVQDTIDTEALGNMIHFVEGESQIDEFASKVVAKLREFQAVEKDLEHVEKEA